MWREMAQMVVICKTPKDPAELDKHYFEVHVPLAKRLPGLRLLPFPPQSTPLPLRSTALHLTMECETLESPGMRNTLSLLLVKGGPANASVYIDESSEAWGEAAKAIAKKLRPSDSVFRVSTNVFALALPGTDLIVAKRVATRLHEGLQAVREKYELCFDITAHTHPEHVNNPGDLERIMKSLVPAQEVWSSPVLVEKA